MIPDQMTAIFVRDGKGPAEALAPALVPTPKPAAGQVLIRVRAAGVNRPDLMQRQGSYPPPPGAPETLGLEVAGEIAAIGPGVARWCEGDQVCALLGGGGYAEYAVVDARHALPIPRGLDFVAAAGLPETVFTVFANVFETGSLKAGETLMVHGATSGIGATAIQMAKAARARVIATGRGADKATQAKALGADRAVDATSEDFVAAAKSEGGADVILDMVGGDYVARDLEALNAGGRLVMIAVQAGAKVEINLLQVMQKRLVLTGSTLRSRHADEKARLAAAVERTVWPWIEAGQVRPVIDRTFPLAQAAQAHARLESGKHVGKVVLVM
jgi:putative PIG3 family NAD(P)H quinone oxidoreductase